MSCYMIDRDHVRYLVEAALTIPGRNCRNSHLTWIWGVDREANTYERGELGPRQHKRAAEVGQMLWDECHASICHRYPDYGGSEDLPGPIDQGFVYRQHRSTMHRERIEPVQTLKACDCYVYQSCVHPEWEASQAKAFIEALRSAAWTSLPGYDDAEWGAPSLDSEAVPA